MNADDLAELRRQIEANGLRVSFDGRVVHAVAAVAIGIHGQSLHRLVEAGRITRERLPLYGCSYSFRLSEILRFLTQREST